MHGDRLRIRARRAEHAETVERSERREDARVAGGDRPPRSAARADSPDMAQMRFSMSTKKPGDRQIRPARIRVDVKQHDQPLAAPLGGDERRAVGKPRPGLLHEAGVGLGEHLTLHADILRRRQAVEGRGRSKSASALGVSHDMAPPSTRPLRRRRTGRRSSAAFARRGPAKRISVPPSSTKRLSAS